MIWGSQDIDGSVGVETGMTRASAELEYIFKCTYQVFEASISGIRSVYIQWAYEFKEVQHIGRNV